jgi:hypothetical protein
VNKPWVWVLVFLLAWIVLVTVLIALGQGAPPHGRPG